MKVVGMTKLCRHVHLKRPSKLSVTTVSQSVEKILAVKLMLQTPMTLVPKFAGHQQLSNHVCYDIGLIHIFA